MGNIVAGLIGLVLIFSFLGFYAVKLKSIPLWIIIVAVLAMIAVEFYQSAVKDGNGTGK